MDRAVYDLRTAHSQGLKVCEVRVSSRLTIREFLPPVRRFVAQSKDKDEKGFLHPEPKPQSALDKGIYLKF